MTTDITFEYVSVEHLSHHSGRFSLVLSASRENNRGRIEGYKLRFPGLTRSNLECVLKSMQHAVKIDRDSAVTLAEAFHV